MIFWLFLLFVGVPLIELALLIQIGKVIGALETVMLVFFTGILGAALARWQGLGVLQQIRKETAQGRLPAGALVDGVLILLAAAVLMTPGVLTDLLGFFCLIPAGRALIKAAAMRRIQKGIERGNVVFSFDAGGTTSGPKEPMRNVTPPSERPDGKIGES